MYSLAHINLILEARLSHDGFIVGAYPLADVYINTIGNETLIWQPQSGASQQIIDLLIGNYNSLLEITRQIASESYTILFPIEFRPQQWLLGKLVLKSALQSLQFSLYDPLNLLAMNAQESADLISFIEETFNLCMTQLEQTFSVVLMRGAVALDGVHSGLVIVDLIYKMFSLGSMYRHDLEIYDLNYLEALELQLTPIITAYRLKFSSTLIFSAPIPVAFMPRSISAPPVLTGIGIYYSAS